MKFRQLFSLALLVLALLAMGCAHSTAFSDARLRPLWGGHPLSDDEITKAAQEWHNDTTLIHMQEGVNLLRHGNLAGGDLKRAQSYLEKAFGTFEDLRDPENFSVAFTSDNQTPYRGRPYERVLVATLLGLLDAADGRCDMAIPAFRAAEFLDARWQPFTFGTDAPIVYAVMLRCLHAIGAGQGDVDRAREGLYRSVRLQLLLEPMLGQLPILAQSAHNNPARQIALALLEVGVPSALISAPANASVSDIFDAAAGESLRFLLHVLKQKEQPYEDIVRPLLSQLDSKSDGKELTAYATIQLEAAFKSMRTTMLNRNDFEQYATSFLARAQAIVNRMEEAARGPVVAFYFMGFGPDVVQEGNYGEIARVAPRSPADARAGVQEKTFEVPLGCGVSNQGGRLAIVLCDSPSGQRVALSKGYQLWSSSFHATTMVGRRFDRILKGRAQFRMGTEVAAVVGGVVALSLLDAGIQSRSPQLEAAAAVVGIAAGAVWLAGRASNPEADTRHVMYDFEQGYMLVPRI